MSPEVGMGLLTVEGRGQEWKMARQLLTACVWLIVAGASFAQPPLEWTPETFPNPQKDPAACGRPYTNASWVCDPNGIITVKEADVLDYIINGMVNTDTPCPCSAYECERNRKGYYIGIAIMNKIKRHPNDPDTDESKANAALKFAYDLENSHWNYGNCEQTTIILFSKEDNMLYTVTGGTARLALTDPLVERISSDAWAYFQPGEDVSSGFKTMVINFKKVFRNQYYEASHFVDYSTIGGASVIHGGGALYSLSALLTTVFVTWLLHG